jgi:hypothetical protein
MLPFFTSWASTMNASPIYDNGLERRLTNVHGHVIQDVLA